MDVKVIRKGLKLTQREFADVCGVTLRTIQNWEAGGVIPLSNQKFIENLRARHETDSYKDENNSDKGVPYYDVDFIGGFDLVINNQTTNPDDYIACRKYDNATCWCNITGHSMEPEICHGDIIALRKIEDWASFIPYGEIYAIVTKNDMRTIKRICRSTDNDSFLLVPSNNSPEYVAQDIKKENILYVYEVMGCLKRF